MSTSLTTDSCIGFAERHRAFAAIVGVLALVAVGVVTGEVIGHVIVQLVELLLGQLGGGVAQIVETG